ncbi:MAG: Ig-like domain-containing protein [Geodermatophilaceae bacterium]
MSRLRRFVISALALSTVSVALAVPASTANAAPGYVTKVIVWGDSMSLAWPAYLAPLLGVPVEGRGVGSEDVQQTEARFRSWMRSATQAQINTTGHLCWCGHVNNNPEHVGTPEDVDSIVPTLTRMRSFDPDGTGAKTRVPAGRFMPIGLQNGPDAPQGSDGYHVLINTLPYDDVRSGTAVNEQMLAAFGTAYAEVRRYLVTDGLQVAGLWPGTATDQENIRVDVPPASLRRTEPPGNANDPHLSTAGKQVTASRLNDLIRADGLIAPSQGLESTTVAGSTANPSEDGQVIRFTATVRPASGGGTPTGTVQFFVNSRPSLAPVPVEPSGEVTSGPTGALPVGQNSIQAVYSGDSNFASSSGSFTQVVNGTAPPPGQLETTTSATSSPASPTTFGTRFRVLATVANSAGTGATPTGTVQFQIDGKNAGAPANLNAAGNASSILSPGTLRRGNHIVKVTYSGDATHLASTYTYTHVVT